MALAIDSPGSHRRYRPWLVVAGWMTAAVIQAAALDASGAVPFEHAFTNGMFSHGMLGILVWQVCRAHAYLELWKRRPVRAVSVHATAGVGALAIWSGAEVTYTRLRYGEDFWPLVYANSWALQLLSAALLYAAAVGLGVIVQSFDREQLRHQREAELELVARDAELTAIKSQLQPHFLLNSLNSILALVEHDPTRASAMLERLASFLHSGFDPSRRNRWFVSTLNWTRFRDYLEDRAVDSRDRLRFTVESDGSGAGSVPLLLQPLVRETLSRARYSAARGCKGEVRVAARRQGARVHVTVSDTGSGPNASHGTSGRGIDLTRRRLRATYGDDGASMIMSREEGGGFTVSLDLPAEPEPLGGSSSPVVNDS
ncbi:MAG: histidine kinase [Chloroflexi bacterium]|nr:histidine kinase [Chloroflexota bacterium]